MLRCQSYTLDQGPSPCLILKHRWQPITTFFFPREVVPQQQDREIPLWCYLRLRQKLSTTPRNHGPIQSSTIICTVRIEVRPSELRYGADRPQDDWPQSH